MTAWFVPRRLEVLGKHTNYAGGNSLLAAVEQGITVELKDAACGISAVTTASSDEELTLMFSHPGALPAGYWGGYLQAVIDRLTLNFGELRPIRLVINSTLPLASDMSPSLALVVAMALALIGHNGFQESSERRENIAFGTDLAGHLACFENGLSFGSLIGVRGVGTFGGSEDHTAMLCCHADRLTRFRFCPIREGESIALPGDLSSIIRVSGVLAEKIGAARELYNAASLRTREIVTAWNPATGAEESTIGDILVGDEGTWEGLSTVVVHSPGLSARLRAFLTESEELIPAAVTALEDGDLDALGRLVERSQRSARDNLGSQVRKTIRMQALARDLGAQATSSFGAGFGGSVWALVPTADADDFAAAWLERYSAEFPEVAERVTTLITRPGGPAHRL